MTGGGAAGLQGVVAQCRGRTRADAEGDRRSRPHRGAGGDAEDVRVGEHIADHGLEDDAGDGETCTDEDAEDCPRCTDRPDDGVVPGEVTVGEVQGGAEEVVGEDAGGIGGGDVDRTEADAEHHADQQRCGEGDDPDDRAPSCGAETEGVGTAGTVASGAAAVGVPACAGLSELGEDGHRTDASLRVRSVAHSIDRLNEGFTCP